MSCPLAPAWRTRPTLNLQILTVNRSSSLIIINFRLNRHTTTTTLPGRFFIVSKPLSEVLVFNLQFIIGNLELIALPGDQGREGDVSIGVTVVEGQPLAVSAVEPVLVLVGLVPVLGLLDRYGDHADGRDVLQGAARGGGRLEAGIGGYRLL